MLNKKLLCVGVGCSLHIQHFHWPVQDPRFEGCIARQTWGLWWLCCEEDAISICTVMMTSLIPCTHKTKPRLFLKYVVNVCFLWFGDLSCDIVSSFLHGVINALDMLKMCLKNRMCCVQILPVHDCLDGPGGALASMVLQQSNSLVVRPWKHCWYLCAFLSFAAAEFNNMGHFSYQWLNKKALFPG